MRFGLIGDRAPAAFDFVWPELPADRSVVRASDDPEADAALLADGLALVLVGSDLFEGRPVWEVTGLIERYREVGAEEFLFDGLSDEQLALVASDLIPEMRADEAAAIRSAGRDESAEPEVEPEPAPAAEPRRPSGLALRGRSWFAGRVADISDERLSKLVGSRAGMAVLFRSMAHLYRPDKAGDFRGAIEFTIGTPRGDDVWTIKCGHACERSPCGRPRRGPAHRGGGRGFRADRSGADERSGGNAERQDPRARQHGGGAAARRDVRRVRDSWA